MIYLYNLCPPQAGFFLPCIYRNCNYNYCKLRRRILMHLTVTVNYTRIGNKTMIGSFAHHSVIYLPGTVQFRAFLLLWLDTLDNGTTRRNHYKMLFQQFKHLPTRNAHQIGIEAIHNILNRFQFIKFEVRFETFNSKSCGGGAVDRKKINELALSAQYDACDESTAHRPSDSKPAPNQS